MECPSDTQTLSFDLSASGRTLANRYRHSLPFPHIVIDNFFTTDVVAKLAQIIAHIRDEDYGVSFKSLAQKKLQLGKIQKIAPDAYPIYECLMGAGFTQFVEAVSGFNTLEADRQFAGAGLHRYYRQGFSEVHLDSNRHPFDVSLVHRVNIIVFLNQNWESDWGGELVLWASDRNKPTEPGVVIQPTFNRIVIFSVTECSWHSVNPINCPANQSRNSLAIYYFNRVKLEGDARTRSVVWHSKRSRPRQLMFEITNRLITRAKPYAPYLRWLRSNKFDGV
jgi:hypothetical protein